MRKDNIDYKDFNNLLEETQLKVQALDDYKTDFLEDSLITIANRALEALIRLQEGNE